MIDISILLPTRNRPDHLRRSVEALRDLALDPSRVEVILAVDDDDPRPPDLTPRDTSAFAAFRTLKGPRVGYRRMNLIWNHMAKLSRGAFIVNWNDDTDMQTFGYDELIMRGPTFSVQFLRRDIFPEADTTFPATSRLVYEALGHLALNAYADNWLGIVAEKSGVLVRRNDIVFHHHRLDDQTTKEIGGYTMDEFNSIENMIARDQDAEKVRVAKNIWENAKR